MKVEVAAREIGVRGYSNLVEGMTPAGRWLKRDMIFTTSFRPALQELFSIIFDPKNDRRSGCARRRLFA